MTNADALLQKLKEREAKLKAKIKDAKAAALKEAASLEAERHRIIGAALAAEMEENQELHDQLQPVIDARTLTPRARKMLGLKPLPKNDNEGEEQPEAAQA